MSQSNREYGHLAQPGRPGVGAILKAARESGGETIFDAAAALRIRAEYLFALEEEDFQSLPGWAFALSYVRTYAEYLGLDPTPVVRRVREQYELRQHMLVEQAARFEEPPRPRRRRLVLAAVLVLAAGGGWYLGSSGVDVAGLFEPVPRALKALIDESFYTVADDSDPAAEREIMILSALDEPTANPAPASPPSDAALLAAAPAAESAGPRFGNLRDEPTGNDKVLIGTHPRGAADRDGDAVRDLVLRARGPVWLTIENRAGSVLLAQQLRKGELYRLPSEPDLSVSADDAGAVEYYVDGQLGGTLGPDRHEVSRLPVIRLTDGSAGG